MVESASNKDGESRSKSGRRLHLREVSGEHDDYDGIGAELRAARTRNGQNLVDLSNILRIRLEFLEALERGRFGDLPAPVYAVGFIRTYAEYVGIDGEDAIKKFKEEAEGLAAQTRLSFPTPEEESRVPRGWLLVLACISAVLIYAGWYYAENKDRLNFAGVPAVPERLAEKAVPAEQVVEKPVVAAVVEPVAEAVVGPVAEAVVEPVAEAAVEPVAEAAVEPVAEAAVEPVVEAVTEPIVEPVAEPVAEAVVEPVVEPIVEPVAEPLAEAVVEPVAAPVVEPVAAPVVEPVAAPVVEPAAEVAEPVIVAATPTPVAEPEPTTPIVPQTRRAGAPEPQVFGAGNWNARVVLTARVDVWVQVSATDGTTLLSRILRQGDKYLTPKRDDVVLTTGNAGALIITVDGNDIAPVGPPGAVRRDISLSADKLLGVVTPQNTRTDN